MLLAYLVLLGILWYGGNLVLKGELSIGALTSFVMYAITMTSNYLIAVYIMLSFCLRVGRYFEYDSHSDCSSRESVRVNGHSNQNRKWKYLV